MEYPVCLADSCVGTLYVCPRGEETELRAVCRGTEKGLYRLYVQGNRGEVLLGVTEDGGLRRCFSRELLAPAGELRRGVLRPCGGEAPERRGFLSRLPEMARTARQGRCVRALGPVAGGGALPDPGAVLLCKRGAGTGDVPLLMARAGPLCRNNGENLKKDYHMLWIYAILSLTIRHLP